MERPRGTVFSEIDHDLAVSLHAEESFLFHGVPPRAGDRLIARPQLEKVWEKHGSSGGKLTFLTILNEYRDADGNLRAEQRSTSVTTETAPGEEGWKPEIVRFQGVVGEDDPLHHDPEWAVKNDYPSVFALGTHQASLMGAYASHWLAPECIRSYKVRFREVVWPGDQLRYAGTVTELNLQKRKASLNLSCINQNNALVSEAWAEYDFS